ncbi:unnamed protein product, partial [Rotaria sp. Silwood1]
YNSSSVGHYGSKPITYSPISLSYNPVTSPKFLDTSTKQGLTSPFYLPTSPYSQTYPTFSSDRLYTSTSSTSPVKSSFSNHLNNQISPKYTAKNLSYSPTSPTIPRNTH